MSSTSSRRRRLGQVLERCPARRLFRRGALLGCWSRGHLSHRQYGPAIFAPTLPRERARRSALKHLLKTFFDNSAGDAVAALLDLSDDNLSAEDLRRLAELIKKAQEEGR